MSMAKTLLENMHKEDFLEVRFKNFWIERK